MNLRDGRLAPAPGSDGLVCRTGGAVLFVSATEPADAVASLLDAVRGATSDTPGRHLARQLAAIVGDDVDGTLPSFALVAATADGTYVKAYGGVEVTLQGPAGSETLSGVGSFTGVDRELTGAFETITAGPAGASAPTASAHIDVQAGTVPGAGFALSLTGGAEVPPVMSDAPTPTEAETIAAEPTTDETPAVTDADLPLVMPPVLVPPMTDPYVPEPEPEPVMAEPVIDEAAPVVIDEAAPVVEAPPEMEPPVYEPPVADPPVLEAPPVVEAPPEVEPPTYEPPLDEVPPIDVSPPVDEPATLPPTELPGGPGSSFTSQLLGDLDDDDVDEREPLPVDLDPAEVRAPEQHTVEVMVQGVVCSRGHFNDPRSRFCSSCGISMVQNTSILTNGPRPPLGVMVFEDGATFSLASDYVVGRQPETSPRVTSGEALPLQVDDPERSISRAHAELRLVNWDVHFINLSEVNGSFVWDTTSNQWIPIPVNQSVMLTPGMRVALGRRSAVFESALIR